MSFLFIIGLIVVWLFCCIICFYLWSKLRKREKWIRIGTGLLLVALLVGLPFWQVWGKKMYYDAWVRAQCEKDGGVTVYEMVLLTPDLLGNYGQIQLREGNKVKPSDKYYYETDKHYYLEGSMNLVRTKTSVVRRSDKKVLGEYTRYGRSGGDLPGPWHHSIFRCPDPANEPIKFESAIFVTGDKL